MVLSRGWGGGWVGKINNKDHLSPAEAGRWAELGNTDDKNREFGLLNFVKFTTN